MQQVEVYLLAPDVPFNPKLMAASQLFNEYFGAGLSSIVFQEIREKKALAYSAYSFYSNAAKQKDNNYVFAYVGTQHDKLKDALTAINQLLNEMPQAELQFNGAKEAVLKQLETSRITNQNVYWTYESAKNRGVDYDLNKQMYVAVQKMTLADLVTFFEQHIKGKKYSICVIGNEKTVDKEILKSFGELKEMELVQLFNY